MSTSAPATTRRVGQAMAAKGIRMVDAPVGRTVDNAYAGTLAIMIGGAPADVEEVKPILACIGDTFTYCGPLGNGHALKLVNNFVSGGIVALLSEALAFGLKAGLTVETVMAGVGSTFARNGILMEVLPAKAFKGDFAPGFMTRLSHKDLRLALELADAAGLDAPVGRGVFETLQRTLDAGYERDDFTSMLRVNEAKAGVEIRLAPAGRD
jgi:3-hydroxyisobutyrate dehydrogenase-like beta-hydroxyacid dehydrogenase